MTLPLDGERLIPEAQIGTRDYRDHLARYAFACDIAANLRYHGGPEQPQILDVACGEGYGTAMLQRFGDAWGADISPRVKAHAEDKYGGDPASAPAFFTADVCDLPWGWTDKFDLVVCFETIEHVESWERALASLERVRAPGGFLVISTPNRGVYGAGNPYHKREHTSDEFEQMLKDRYRWVQLMRQVEMPTSLLVAQSSTGDVELARIGVVGQLPPEMYVVAVCGDDPIDLASIALA